MSVSEWHACRDEDASPSEWLHAAAKATGHAVDSAEFASVTSQEDNPATAFADPGPPPPIPATMPSQGALAAPENVASAVALVLNCNSTVSSSSSAPSGAMMHCLFAFRFRLSPQILTRCLCLLQRRLRRGRR